MPKFYGYARVSTQDQSDRSLELQLIYLRKKAERQELEFVPIQEKASGSSFDRPEFQRMLKMVQAGDYVGVYDNSRFGRNTEESIASLKLLHSKHVNVMIGESKIDPDAPRDKLLFSIEAAISDFYRTELRMKSESGIEMAKKDGDWIFTSRLYGYRQDESQTVHIVEEEAKVIRYIFNCYDRGESIYKITNDMNSYGWRTRTGKEFHASTVRRYILKPIYMGYYKEKGSGGQRGQDSAPYEFDNLVKSKKYPPIVDEDLWYRVFDSYRGVKRKHAVQLQYRYSGYTLTGLLKCFYCFKLGKATTYVHNISTVSKKQDKLYANYVNRTHLKSCGQKYHTFREIILEDLFEFCFYLVFANYREIEQIAEEHIRKIV